jgi:hypothetical protein
MRWLARAVTLTVLTSGSVSAEELVYHDTIRPTRFDAEWNEHVAVDFSIRYDTDTDELVFYTLGDESFAFALDRAGADSLIAIADTYKRWNLKASNMSVELEKEIAPLGVGRTLWRRGDAWSHGPETEISAVFFSQSEKKHLLVLVFPELVSQAGSGSRHRPEALYFDWTNALELRRALEPDVVKAFRARPRGQEAIDAEFR